MARDEERDHGGHEGRTEGTVTISHNEIVRRRGVWRSWAATFALLLLVAAPLPGSRAAAQAQSPAPDVVKVLQEIKAADKDQMAVSEEDGRFLQVMVVTRGARRVLEIGTADGYSAIWIGLGLRETGGRLTTIEFDPAHAQAAARNIRRAGLSDIVTVVTGDAFRQIPTIPGTFDFVFLDAWKRDYKRFLDMVLPRLEPRGVFLGHNVVNKQSEMGDFLDAIHNDPRLRTAIVKPGHEGMSITVKLK
jgi:predicted O-methyltransferase YrrM